MNYEELRNSIKEGNIAPFYIFEGPEDFLIEFCIDELKKKLVEPWSEMMNFKSYTTIPPVKDAEDFLETLPVMSERKLVIFRKCGFFSGNIKNKKQWESVFSNIAPFNCVVLWEETGEKGKKPTETQKICEEKGTVVNFPLRPEATLKSWVAKIAAANKKKIDAKNASYLALSLERKMRVIKTELEKIISYAKTEEITREDIEAVIIKPVDENVFALVDAVFEGRRELCYKYLYNLRRLEKDPVSLLSLLSGQLINIYKAKLFLISGLTHSQTVQKLGGGFSAEKATRKAEKLKAENIEKLIKLCCEADCNVKQGKIGGWAALETLVAEYKFY